MGRAGDLGRARRRSGGRARTHRPARSAGRGSLVITSNGQRNSERRSIAGRVELARLDRERGLALEQHAVDGGDMICGHPRSTSPVRPVRPVEPHLHLELVSRVGALGLVRLVHRLPGAHDVASVVPPDGAIGGHDRRDAVRDGERQVEGGAAAHRGADHGRAPISSASSTSSASPWRVYRRVGSAEEAKAAGVEADHVEAVRERGALWIPHAAVADPGVHQQYGGTVARPPRRRGRSESSR